MPLNIAPGAVMGGLSAHEMRKAFRPVRLGNMRFTQDPDEEEVNDVGVVQGNPGGGGGGGGGGAPALGPVQGAQPGGGGGMGPGGGGQWVPTTPMPTSAEINRGNGDGWNNWGVSGWGWGWPYYGYGYGYPVGYGYPYGYGYGYPQQQPQGMVCQQSEDDPKKFICEPQYPQYQQARAYAWAPPFWGW